MTQTLCELTHAQAVSPYLSYKCLRTEDSVHTTLCLDVVTVPCGPNDSPDHHDMSGDCHEQPVAGIHRPHTHRSCPKSATSSPWDPYGMEVSHDGDRRARVSTTASKVYPGRQHAGAISKVRPSAALAAEAPPKYCVCRTPVREEMRGMRWWNRFRRRRRPTCVAWRGRPCHARAVP